MKTLAQVGDKLTSVAEKSVRSVESCDLFLGSRTIFSLDCTPSSAEPLNSKAACEGNGGSFDDSDKSCKCPKNKMGINCARELEEKIRNFEID